ncbi:MAG: hypothetical protein ACO1N5_13690 [Noviherbaspirillum sp.]
MPGETSSGISMEKDAMMERTRCAMKKNQVEQDYNPAAASHGPIFGSAGRPKAMAPPEWHDLNGLPGMR